ncbi:MAG TPA: HypC/HybG/HupF family hydrogenase formation chaperone [Methanospirillum sp.]|jgi:hydrogenase expression/formation protein HypC|uniref:HypC/HybG/HupF family hydrogenase formation chaperone n=1 Tax=Methanospirillum sp. TaxID=45200 RepID=UPI0016B0F454|nr:HypC/HybG/HupF family hydrogenase formation chaperone [Methanospirillum sp.]MCZ2417534.1 HypC/HybG/HupF family hydrogenase formation chaperone [Burkholderiales bacterium]NLL10419.1 HypC/HybG/HupF family hydrogenase formation chaperone [Methanomicrobiales archaeon]HPY59109.1 HypC/HybG/HupF family hydrogenase formation chaperone [Methanospirillum sp.]HQC00695.1 HypC/HybG/HupF family hydrogenase formation chaperone [Methanospirillum sp.]
MCIAIPAEILEIRDDNTALVDFGSLKQDIRVDLVDVQVGDFVLVHVGFAIQKVNRDDALETRELFRQCYAAMEEAA